MDRSQEYKGGEMMAKHFSDETESIVQAHKADFDCTNYEARLKAAGGYRAYVKSLGGVFRKYLDYTGKVETVSVFHEICEYVWGLFSIYGFDYSNGQKYVRWSGGSPFYVGGAKGKCNGGKIDDLCGLASKSKTTCCNWAIDTLLKKMGWLPNGAQQYCTQAGFGELVTKKSDLRPGDIVHFFKDQNGVFDPSDTSTYRHSGWHHVVIVYDVTDTGIIVADGGSRLQHNGGKWLYEVPKAGNGFGGTYGTSDKWLGRHIHTLTDTGLFRVRRTWADAGSQIGAYRLLENAKAAVETARKERGETYTVYNGAGIPVWPFYRVRASWDDPGSQAGAFAFYKNAAFIADLNVMNVYDNWGELLHVGVLPELPVIVALKEEADVYGEPAGNVVGRAAPGKYTITDLAKVGILYGRLKSGAGWVSLQRAQRPE